MKLLILDNYDSFTYNLVHMVRELGVNCDVIRNDKITADDALQYDKIMLSPGPGIPEEAGKMPEIIQAAAGKLPVLGICLGHQAMAEAFGGKLINLERVYHGVATTVHVNAPSSLFRDVPEQFTAGRYHSWIVDGDQLEEFNVMAKDDQGVVMGMKHKTYDLTGLQFHPESILTEYGSTIMNNWINA